MDTAPLSIETIPPPPYSGVILEKNIVIGIHTKENLKKAEKTWSFVKMESNVRIKKGTVIISSSMPIEA